MRLPIRILPYNYAIIKLPPGSVIPDWVDRSKFYSITDTGDEYSIICADVGVPVDYPCESGMTIFKIEKKLEFSQTGIINSIAGPLAEKKIPLFTISTFNTDYFLIKKEYAKKAALVFEGYHDIDDRSICS